VKQKHLLKEGTEIETVASENDDVYCGQWHRHRSFDYFRQTLADVICRQGGHSASDSYSIKFNEKCIL